MVLLGTGVHRGAGNGEEAVFLSQVHGSRIIDSPRPFQEGDGMLLARKGGRAPGLSTADCLPVFAVWKDLVGCAHCGWRGLSRGILEELVRMGGGAPEAVILGPCICGECYTVGEEVRSLLADPDQDIHPPGRLDLKLAAVRAIPGETGIFSVEICTLCDPGFHSHRRNGTTLRNRFWLAPERSRYDIRHSFSIKATRYDNSGRRAT